MSESQMTIMARQLADAYEAVARADHYLVGVLSRDNWAIDLFDAAEQVLITRQNALASQTGRAWRRLELALDMLAYDRRRRDNTATAAPENAAQAD